MERALIVLLLLLLIPTVYALCEDGQVDINSASAEELDKIKWVGKTVAELIIKERPFSSIDELIDINYITESRLEEIKQQGLACVEEEDKETEDEPEEKEESEQYVIEEDMENKEDKKEETLEIKAEKEKTEEEFIPSETIILSPKDIKSEENFIDKTKYAGYGLIIFGLLISTLVILKFLRRQNGFE